MVLRKAPMKSRALVGWRRREHTPPGRQINVRAPIGASQTQSQTRPSITPGDIVIVSVRPAADDRVLAGAVDGADVEAESWCKMPVRKAFARRSHSGSRSLDSKEGSWHTQRESE